MYTIYIQEYERESILLHYSSVLQPLMGDMTFEVMFTTSTISTGSAFDLYGFSGNVGWAINRIPYCSSDGCAWLGVGYGVGRLAVGLENLRHILDDQQLYVHACKYDNACMLIN